MITCTCQSCGTQYKKPAVYKDYLEKTNSVFYKWSLSYCDKCRRQKEREALKHLPTVLNVLSSPDHTMG